MTPAELHAARKRLGMTQAQLADALRLRGRDRTRTVRAWEVGERPITGPVQVAVELMLGNTYDAIRECLMDEADALGNVELHTVGVINRLAAALADEKAGLVPYDDLGGAM